MKLVPLTDELAAALVPQPHQSDLSDEERVILILTNAAAGPSLAAVDEAGTVLGVGGIITDHNWPHRGVVWSVLSASVGPHLLPLTRALRDWLDASGLRRLELYVDAQFPQGCRWARRLGFHLETPLPMGHFLPNGNGAYMFGRVR